MSSGAYSATLKRRLGITDAVRLGGFIRTEALADQFGVSAVTIRSDLAYLQSQNLVIRTNGGARPCQETVAFPAFDEVPSLRQAHLLAQAVAARLEAGQTVFLDNSQAASFVPLHASTDNVRFIVNSLESFHIASRTSEASVSLLGGEYDRQGQPLSTLAAEHALAFYAIDVAVLSVGQIGEQGFCCLNSSGGCLGTVLARTHHTCLLIDRLDRQEGGADHLQWREPMSLFYCPDDARETLVYHDWEDLSHSVRLPE